ncbi:DUF4349 domain-containing protein [Saccharothrix australiensis]|uniref:Uncharacterized protein DUF4349 n=1 Tax=Saccharothrix australiensis TaxID=2072 RepID=A0A495WDS1_9PSEU|nr:DUF4349 domain-containing protein [Saccharothrix australiensis]RKT57928.1 uncharacterized protein DUF4349 [Saccharothrix australiensis]
MGGRVGALAVLAALVLAGCSAGGSGGSVAVAPAEGRPDGAGRQAPGVAPEKAGPEKPNTGKAGTEQPNTEKAGPEQQGQAAGVVAANRHLVRTASVDLRASEVGAVLAKAKELALAEGGFPAQENTTRDRGTVTLRVPADRLDAVLTSLSGLPGVEVTRREVRTEDVTDQVVDVEARLANQRASVERVRGLLERAASTSEITQVEAELTKRQGELESLQRRHDSLKGQVALSTLTVAVGTRTAPVAPEEENFLTALRGGWDAVVDAGAWSLVVIGGALPFVVVLGTPLVGYLAWRRRRKSAVTL